MKNSDPIFWPGAEYDTSLKAQRDKNYTDCINILQTQWYQADLDQRFALGDQDIWGLMFNVTSRRWRWRVSHVFARHKIFTLFY